MLWPSQCMGSKQQREGGHTQICWASSGSDGHEGDFGVAEYLVCMTGSQGQVWDGDLV